MANITNFFTNRAKDSLKSVKQDLMAIWQALKDIGEAGKKVSSNLAVADSFKKINTQSEKITANAKKQGDAMNRLIAIEEKQRKQVNKNTNQQRKFSDQQTKTTKTTNTLWQSMKRLLAIYLGFTAVTAVIKNFVRTATALDSLDFAIKKVITDSKELGQTNEFLSRIINAFGLDLVDATRSYIKFRAAVGATSLSVKEGQKIFESFAKAGAVLGLRQDELNGVFLALEQMISKGKVTTEELRRQLGERIPGAFNIMANAMDVSVTKLDKMLRAGAVLSEDALPKFARELEKTFGIEQVTRVDTLASAQARMSTAWKEFVKAVEGSGFLTNIFNKMGGAITALRRIITGSVNSTVTAYKRQQDELISLQAVLTDTNTSEKERLTSLQKLKAINPNIVSGISAESIEYNLLKIRLEESNTEEAERVEMLEEFIRLNPDVIKDIDTQAISYNELAKSIELANNKLLDQIILEELTKDERKNTNKIAKETIALAKAEFDVNAQIKKIDKEIADGKGNQGTKIKLIREKLQAQLLTENKIQKVSILDLTKSVFDLGETYDLITEKSRKAQSLKGINDQITEFELTLFKLVTVESDLIDVQSKGIDFAERRVALLALINKGVEEEIEGKKEDKDLTEDQLKAIRIKALESIALIRQEIQARLGLNSLIREMDSTTEEERIASNERTAESVDFLFRAQTKIIEQFANDYVDLNELMQDADSETIFERVQALGLHKDLAKAVLSIINSRINASRNLNKKETKDEADALKLREQQQEDHNTNIMNIIHELADEEILAEERKITALFEQGKISRKEMVRLEVELAVKILKIRRDALEEILLMEQLTVDEIARIKEELFRIEQQLEKKKRDEIKKTDDARIASNDEWLKGVQDVVNASSEIITAFNDRRLMQAEELRDYQIALAGDSVAGQLRAENLYDREVKKLRRKQAIQDKILAGFNVILNTAIAVSEAAGDPFLTALAYTTGALALAAVLATPIPALKEGGTVEKDGKIRVSEEGREMKVSKSGAISLTPLTESIIDAEAGDMIIPHGETQRILAEAAMNNFVNEGAELDMSGTNSYLRQIRDKETTRYENGYKIVNKRGVKGRYAVRL